MSISRNVLANYLGLGWRVVMSLAFVPIYVEYLGVEAYGLIGILIMLQTSLELMDMGLRPTLSREMARFTGGVRSKEDIWDLLRSVELLVFPVALSACAFIWFASEYLAEEWIQSEKMSSPVVSHAIALMGPIAATQFVEAIYRSCLAGLQKQVVLNVVMVITATLRGIGSICVLAWVSPTIHAFLMWQAVVSICGVAIAAAVAYKMMPQRQSKPRFSGSLIREVRSHASGIVATTVLALLLTQLDKVLLTRFLPLEAFGQYTLALVVTGTLLTISDPVVAAYFPRFSELLAQRDEELIKRVFHQAAQMINVVIGSVAAVLVFFGAELLFAWTGDAHLSVAVAPLVSVLAIGSLLNALYKVPYQIQVASGWTSLGVVINAIAVLALVPALVVAIPRYGTHGAAWVWVALNAGYVTFGAHFMYKRLLITEKWTWYRTDVAQPLFSAATTAMICRAVLPVQNDANPERLHALGVLVTASAVILAATCLATPLTRRFVLERAGLYFSSP